MIEAQHVSKRYGGVVALDDVCLTFNAGERIALVGSNGSGKTTLLRAILGLIRVDGKVIVRGYDVAQAPQLALRELAYIPQIAPPIDVPVRDVLTAYARLRGMDPSRVVESAAAFHLPMKAIGRTRFKDLSGGMKQKLLAAMALSTSPRILVCDEPTANLDAEARSTFFSILDALPTESIVILCSHRVDEVHDFVTRVVALKDGRVGRGGEDGPLATLGSDAVSLGNPARGALQ